MTIAELRALEAQATPGPWGGAHIGIDKTGALLGYGGFGRCVSVWAKEENRPLVTDGICACEIGLLGRHEENARLIACVRNALPALFDIAEAAEALSRALADMADLELANRRQDALEAALARLREVR